MKLPCLFVFIALPLLAGPPHGQVPAVNGKASALQMQASQALTRAARAKAKPLPAFSQDLDFLAHLVQGKQVVANGKVLTMDYRAASDGLEQAQRRALAKASSLDWAGRSVDELSPPSLRWA